MRHLGFFGLLIPLLIAGVAGIIGYNWGYSEGLAHSVANGASVVYARGFGWGGGGFFGLILGLFVLFFLFSLIRRAAFGWGGGPGRHGMYGYGRGGWGHGYWHGDSNPGTPGTSGAPGAPGTPGNAASGRPYGVPPFVEGMLQDWHAHAHGQSSSASNPTTPPSGGPSPA